MTVAAGVIRLSGLALPLVLFLVFLAVTMFTSVVAGPHSDMISEFYIGDRRLSPMRYGMAMCGDYISAATLLGSTGLVCLTGYDGLLYLTGTAVGWIVILLLIAEPLRNSGRFTLGDTIAQRIGAARQRWVRLAVGLCALVVSLFYLVAQLTASVALLAQFTGVPAPTARAFCTITVGTFVVFYVAVGGMPGTTFIQVAKTVLLVAVVAVAAGLVLSHFGWSGDRLLGTAAANSGHGEAFLRPGLRFGASTTSRIDFFSLALSMALGVAGLPHIVMRLLSPDSTRRLRGAVLWTIALVGTVCLAVGVLGLGAAAIVGTGTVKATDPSGNAAVLLLAQSVGGNLLTAAFSCLVFATVLSVAAGVTLAAASSLAHDVYVHAIRKGRVNNGQELAAARTSAAVAGALGILLALLSRDWNASSLAFLAFAIAASSIVPTLVYTLFWPRFTARGALFALYGGLGCALLLVASGPLISSTPTSLLPTAHFAWFPLQNPGVVSIPAGFLLGWLGTVTSPTTTDTAAYREFEARALLGTE
ncbi:sodium/solute symporter [Streptomyces sp. HUAS TT20]|uniref:sodium/solute symporter n=1 Tax=Streptomyces sp. HUAS TT20 TaxID=3447509 RepID=UPI0021D8252A|nr:cation acetate symporter [Streptomyces sp. HUAS 15-9]UXY32040.1 cation acetate symporter [Streptomyces sp. HUAS 15-9]